MDDTHTQLIQNHTSLLGRLEERSESQAKQINANYDLLSKMDEKLDGMDRKLSAIRSERNLIASIANVAMGAFAGWFSSHFMGGRG